MKTIKLLLATAITGLLLTTIQAQTWITNGLVAYYPFNGNANDMSGNGNNGIVVGATLTSNQFGIGNSAYSFSSNSYIYATAPNLPLGNSPRTISGWIMLPALSSQYVSVVASWGYGDWNPADCTGAGFGLWIDVNGTSLSSWGSFNDVTGNYSFHTNIFYSVAVTYDGNGNVTLFVNGSIVTTKNVGGLNTFTNNYLLQFGKSTHMDTYGWNDYLTGSLDNVRVYNRALSSTEVAQLYVLESAPVVNIQKAVYLTSSNLKVGTNYQVQVSSDLVNWTNFGSVFTATTNTWRSTNYWDVANWNQLYFRLQ
jgi:trimeric autotransporter adhesin